MQIINNELLDDAIYQMKENAEELKNILKNFKRIMVYMSDEENAKELTAAVYKACVIRSANIYRGREKMRELLGVTKK